MKRPDDKEPLRSFVKRMRPVLKRHGEALRKRGIFLCGFEKLSQRERGEFVKFLLSLDPKTAESRKRGK